MNRETLEALAGVSRFVLTLLFTILALCVMVLAAVWLIDTTIELIGGL